MIKLKMTPDCIILRPWINITVLGVPWCYMNNHSRQEANFPPSINQPPPILSSQSSNQPILDSTRLATIKTCKLPQQTTSLRINFDAAGHLGLILDRVLHIHRWQTNSSCLHASTSSRAWSCQEVRSTGGSCQCQQQSQQIPKKFSQNAQPRDWFNSRCTKHLQKNTMWFGTLSNHMKTCGPLILRHSLSQAHMIWEEGNALGSLLASRTQLQRINTKQQTAEHLPYIRRQCTRHNFFWFTAWWYGKTGKYTRTPN